MDQITTMKITGITFSDFRNHKKPESYTFGDISYITGHNGTGKTTMAHGICYALYGVSYYGEQKIERLMHENAAGTQVKIDFTDQNGNTHTLVRNRNGDKTVVLLDSYIIRQSDIEHMFCDKDTFLSMFNPTYLTERLGEKGRNLILKHIQPVSTETVLGLISENFREQLHHIDLNLSSPEAQLKSYREAIKQTEEQAIFLQGHIESIEEVRNTAGQKLSKLYEEQAMLKAKCKALADKQFAGIETEDLPIQRDMLLSKLSESSSEDQKAISLKAKIEEIRKKIYVSKFAQAQSENAAELKLLSNRYNALADRINGLKAGTQCPICLMCITEKNLPEVQNGMTLELQKMAAHGQELLAQGNELIKLDNQAKAVFEQFKAEDIKKTTEELAALKSEQNSSDSTQIRASLEEIERLQKFGNLNDDEYSELCCLTSELTGVEAQIQSIREMTDDQKLKDANMQKEIYAKQIQKYKDIIDALSEFICKRTEIAVADLQMPNVKIKLFDVVRSTGEVIGVFKFTYKNRDYATLSLSEKTLAGIEITAMLRKITGLDYPVCVDNTESIAAFNSVSMPSQTLLLRFMKGQPLTVQFRNNAVEVLRQPVQELKKAS